MLKARARTFNSGIVKRAIAGGVSALALVAGSAPAYAQDDPDEDAAAQAAEGEQDGGPQIVVTGSRLITVGMDSPVPVTAVNAEELEAMNPTSLIASVSQLPQFYGNQTPNSSAFFTRGGTGNLNLRGLGVNRTLTLLNGRRFPASSAFGGVDVNLFPEAMIKGIETTTGGASAAYGTDAVAGVVNFILDTDYTGLEASLQGGITERGDAESYEGSLSWGANIGDRGHFLISGAYADQAGIVGYEGRDWYKSQGSVLDASTNTWRTYDDMHSMNTSFDGIILANPGTALYGKAFDANGNMVAFNPGTLHSVYGATSPYAGQANIGAYGAWTVGGDGDDLNELTQLWPETDRYSVFAYADYEVADGTTVFAQFTRGRNHQRQNQSPVATMINLPPSFTTATIYSGNAYLPADVQQIMTDNNIASFRLGRYGSSEDLGDGYYDDTTTQNVGTVGFESELEGDGLMGGWKINGFYQYGHSERVWDQYALRVDRIHAALDAVYDTDGNIVCNVSLYSDGAAAYPGCEPINLFGRGNASDAAVDYVMGADPGETITTPIYFADGGYDLGYTYSYTSGEAKRNITTFRQHLAELSFAGDLVDAWAGPISLAFGATFRDESILQLVQDPSNPSSNHQSYFPVLCSGAVGGLRHANSDCTNTVGFQFSKVSNIIGDTNVLEVFGETLVPLFDNGRGTSAQLNAAVRWADYKNSGVSWAYKAGLDFSVFEDLRLRGTYSRDVRAPNLSELYDKTGGFANNLTDPRDGSAITGITAYTGGNPDLVPEVADTFTAGGVYRPSWLPGVSMSVDWYKIRIEDAISTVGYQQVLNRCFNENAQEFCDFITLNSDDDIVLIGNPYVNVAQSRVEGVDVEFGYRRDVRLFGGGDETLGARVFASWLLERSDTNSTGVTTDFVGWIGLSPSSGTSYPYPHFKATGNLTYGNGPFNMFLQGRVIGGGVSDPNLLDGEGVVGGTAGVEDNTVPAIFYADLRLAYDFEIGGSDAELWGSVTNLLDQDPPITAYYAAFPGYTIVTNTALYDVLGRRFTIGIKFRM